MSSSGRREAFFSAVQQSLSANLEPPPVCVCVAGGGGGLRRSNSGDPARLAPSSPSPSGQDSRMVVALQTPPLAGSSSPLPWGSPQARVLPSAARPSPSALYHAGWPAGRGRGALGAPSAPPSRGGALGVRCLLLPSAAAGLSRVLGRRSAPGIGSNCGPGVRQPSSRGRGPDRGALGGGRGLAERRDAGGPPRPRTLREPECRPCWKPRTPQRSCSSAAETCAGAASMRTADPPSQGSTAPSLPGGE